MKKEYKIILIALIGIVVDRVTKLIINANVNEGSVLKIIGNFFRITYLKNTGAAWSILEDKVLFLIVISILFLVLIVGAIKKDNRKTVTNILGYSFIISGVIGNLIDRIIYRYVIDFLSFKIFSYYFPVFNIADILIVVGVVLFIIDIILEGKQSPMENEYKKFKEVINGKDSSRKK